MSGIRRSPFCELNDFPLRRMLETFFARWTLNVENGAITIRELALLANMTVPAVRTSLSKEGFKLEKWQSSLKAGEDEGGYRLPSGDALLWLSRRRGYILNRASLNFDDHGPVVTQILSNAELDFVTALAHIMGFTGQTVDGIAIESGQDQKWLRALFGGEAAAIDLPAVVHWPMPWGLPSPPSSDWP